MNRETQSPAGVGDHAEEPHAELVRRAQRGDAGALESLLARVRARLFRWALVQTGDPDDADDVVQTVSLGILRGLRGFDGRSSFTTWAYALTRNACTDLERKLRSRSRAQESAALESHAVSARMKQELDQLGDREAAVIVRNFFEQLSPRQRELLELVDLQGYTAAGAAAMLEIDAATARVHLLRARRALRERILADAPHLVESR